MNTKAANAFALWLAKEHPNLFKSAAAQASHLGSLGQDDSGIVPIDTSSLDAITPADVTSSVDDTSVFSKVASGLGDAISSVGSALTNPSVLNSFAGAASNYFKAQATASQANAQTAVLNTQLQRAQAGLPPAPITYTASGQPVYVPTPGVPIPGAIAQGPTYGTPGSSAFGYGITAGGLNALQPNFFQQYGTYLLIGGALLAVALLLSSRNQSA
jgi:hypothetical protein